MLFKNISYLGPLGSIERGSLGIIDGKFCDDQCMHTVIIDASDYLAIPLLQAKTNQIPLNYIENALENGTECIIDSNGESNPAVQFGAFPGVAKKLGQTPIADLIHFHTTHKISVNYPASFILFYNSDSLSNLISKFDYKTSIRAVVLNGSIVMARGELANFMTNSSLLKYYQGNDTQTIENVDPNASYCLDSVVDAIKDIKDGKFVIVVDNMDRENEGDLVIAAQALSTEKMAFMVKHSGYFSSQQQRSYLCPYDTRETGTARVATDGAT